MNVDQENPWPGLASFTEETKAFFHGRDQEVTELFRRVQRKHLTILFGQSGHGKSSLLRAGLVPKLRPEGYCPIYIRLDHTPGSMPLSEQIKEAVFRGTAASGAWTKPGAAEAGESLWEFLHHRDDQLKDASGRVLTPLIIFDQFEEIFTLAQTDATGRARAESFITDLADLVENRPPLDLEEKLEENPSAADRFDFDRADYRLLITLREDYLPHLEALKKRMPSVTQNRLRLSRLGGKQAHESVLKTGGKLVTPEVAEAIVKFVSGAEDLAHAEVEPSLLSLVCRELNESRFSRGHDTITTDLLEGSRDAILAEYYERTLADVPTGAREFIEDELLTSSGFRESVGEERVLKALADSGAPKSTLPSLVNHRLLRIEERLDVRRVEITHDVLCSIVKTSRDTRLQRLALRKARRLRFAVGGLAIGLAGVVAALVAGTVRARRLERETAQRSSRTDFTFGSQLLGQGRVSEGLAYLARAVRSDPENHAVGSRLISALAYRSFAFPVGPVLSHGASTTILGMSSDGSRMVTATDGGTLSFWNTQSGERVTDPVKLPAVRLAVAVTPSGDRVAVSLADGTTRVWEIATGRQVLGPLQTGVSTTHLQYSPNGAWLASGNAAGTVIVWNGGSGDVIAKLDIGDRISALDFSPDGSRLAVATYTNTWRVWSLPSGAPSTEVFSRTARSTRLRFSPDGRVLVSEVPQNTGLGSAFFDSVSGKQIGQSMRSLYGPWLLFSPDGRRLVTTGIDDVTRVWKVPSGELVRQFDFMGRLILSRDGRRLLVTNRTDGAVHLVDINTGKSLIEPLHNSYFTSAQFSADEQEIWTSDREGSVRRWRATASAATPLEVYFADRLGGGSGGYSVRAPRGLAFSDNGGTTVRDWVTGQLTEPPMTLPESFRANVLSDQGAKRRMVSTSDNPRELLDLSQPGAVARHVLNPEAMSGQAFSAGSERLIQLNRSKRTFYVWDTATGNLVREFSTGDLLPNGFLLDRAGARLAVTNADGALEVFDTTTGARIGNPIHHPTTIGAFAFSTDGSMMATCSSGVLRVTELATGRTVVPPLSFPENSGPGGLYFSQDDRSLFIRVAGASELRIQDLSTGAVRTMAMTGGIYNLDSRDRRVSLGDPVTGRVQVWSAATGQILMDPIEVGGSIGTNVRFTPDDRFVSTRTAGQPSVALWPAPPYITDTPVPAWLGRLAAAVAGGEVNAAGEFQAAPSAPGIFAALKAELDALPDDAPYAKWGRWFLADPATRTINPESPLTAAAAKLVGNPDPLAPLIARQNLLVQQTNWTEAETLGRQILDETADKSGTSSPAYGEQLWRVGRAVVSQDRFRDAEPILRDSLPILERSYPAGDIRRSRAQADLGRALAGQSKDAEAEALLIAAYDARSGAVAATIASEKAALTQTLADFYDERKRPADAALWRNRPVVIPAAAATPSSAAFDPDADLNADPNADPNGEPAIDPATGLPVLVM